jgi:hypothetical protein
MISVPFQYECHAFTFYYRCSPWLGAKLVLLLLQTARPSDVHIKIFKCISVSSDKHAYYVCHSSTSKCLTSTLAFSDLQAGYRTGTLFLYILSKSTPLRICTYFTFTSFEKYIANPLSYTLASLHFL